MKIISLIVTILLIVSSVSLYDRFSGVTILTAKDFSQVKKGIWLVQFFAPWCGHCKSLAPEYEKAAKALKGIANIAAIDGSAERTDIQVQGFPTIKFFVDGKVSDYDGPRTSDGIIQFIFKNYRRIVKQRSGSNAGDHGSGDQGSGFDQKDVIVLTDDNFEDQVYGDSDAWFVQFYAPWCGHCKSLAPEYAQLATNLKGQVKVAKVDATQHKQAAGRFGVSGYPTIKFFPAGKKDDSSAVDYDGARNAASMAEWARERTVVNFEHVRLTSQKDYDQYCQGRTLCVITVLPHILDSSETERAQHLQVIKEVALKFRGKPFKFMWSQGGDHFDFEQKLGTVGVGYPVVVSIFQSKKIFGKLRKSFSEQNFETFLSEILNNKAKFNKLPPLPKLATIKVEPTKNSQEQSHSSFEDEGQCTKDKCTAPPQNEAEL